MSSLNTCIYRHINSGRCCCFKSKNNYCNIHINNRNSIYEIINLATENKNKLTKEDIYKIYNYIYKNDKIYVKDLIFKTFLKTIYGSNINALLKLYNKYLNINLNYNNHKNNNSNNNYWYDKIEGINKNTYDISLKLKKEQLKKIQDLFKYTLIRNHYYNDDIADKILNTADPFTFDNIYDINKKERFIYNDNNNYYCFKALELYYFIDKKGNNWNPYTKKEIEPKIIRNLKIFIELNNLNNNNDNRWTSVLQAFTDVSQSLEKIGFYNNTEWFLKLTSRQIKNIIRLYKIMSNNNNDFFKEEDIKEETIFYDFAREIIKLFDDGNSHFLLCCNFMKALSMYSNDFFTNLPEWMTDIENPISINPNISLTMNSSINSSNNIFYRLINNLDIIYLINIMEN